MVPGSDQGFVHKLVGIIDKLHGTCHLHQRLEHFLALPTERRAFFEQGLHMGFDLAFAVEITIGELCSWAWRLQWQLLSCHDSSHALLIPYR